MERSRNSTPSADSSLGRIFAAVNPYADRPLDPANARLLALRVEQTMPNARPRIGRYQLERWLGAGATSVVFSGKDVDLGREVAVKLLRAGVSRQRLVREAQALAQLRHPNVVSFHELGEDDSQLYIVMELIHGSSLKQVLETTQASRAEIVALFLQAGRGLQAAHEAKLVHRDFKPANVLVGVNGRVCVVDFGLVKAHDEPERAAPNTAGSAEIVETQTAAGTVLGTPYFMSPEQRAGHMSDAKSDQYAFCLSLWLALYGQHPVMGVPEPARYLLSTWRALLKPPAAKAPRWLHRVIVRGLHPEPNQRWRDMGSLLERLSRSPLRRLLRRIAFALLVVALGVVVGTLVSIFRASGARERASREQEREALVLARESAEHAADQTHALAARLSRADPTTAHLLMREIRHPGDVLSWFSSAVAIWHTPISRAILRGHTDRTRGVAFSPDGTLVATASFDGTARLWRADGRGSAAVLRGHSDHVHFANFSPDGRMLVTSSRDGTAMVWDLERLDAPAHLEGHSSIVWWAGFSPDGRWIVTTSKDSTARLWDATSMEIWSNPPPPAAAVFAGHTDQVWWADIHPESTHVVTISKDRTARIWSLLDPDAEPLVLPGHTDNPLRARFSPDGAQVMTTGVGGQVRLWTVTEDSLQVLETSSRRVEDAVFSRDGTRLLVANVDQGLPQVWDTRDGHLIAELKGGSGISKVGAFGGESGWIAVGESDGCVRVWPDLASAGPSSLCGLGDSIVALDVSPDGNALVAGTDAGSVRVWDAASWASPVLVNPRAKGYLRAVASRAIVAGNEALTELFVHDVVSSHPRPAIHPEPGDRFYYADLHPSLELLLTSTDAGTVTLWDLATASARWSVSAGREAGAFFAGDHQVMTLSRLAGSWRLWDIRSGESVAAPRPVPVEVRDFIVDPAGEHLATVGADGAGLLWDVGVERAPVRVFQGESAYSPSFVRAPGGQFLSVAVALVQGQAWVFDLRDGEVLLTIQQSAGPIVEATFSDSIRHLAFSTIGGRVEIWDVARQKQIDAFSLGATATRSMSLSDDGRWLAVAEFTSGRVLIRDVLDARWIGEIDLVRSPLQVEFVGATHDLWVLGTDDGLFRLQIGEIISGGSNRLLDRPGRWTSACLTLQQRMDLVGRSRVDAVFGAMTCELSQGRLDRLWASLR